MTQEFPYNYAEIIRKLHQDNSKKKELRYHDLTTDNDFKEEADRLNNKNHIVLDGLRAKDDHKIVELASKTLVLERKLR